MHVLFLAPETGIYNHEFVRALKQAGARVSALGHAPASRLAPALTQRLDAYQAVRSLFDAPQLVEAARAISGGRNYDRVETIDEPLVGPAAQLRHTLGLPGLTPAQATLCRDKAAMKDHLRAHGIPCAQSAAAQQREDVVRFAEQVGFPLVLKPREGFGTLQTYRVATMTELEQAVTKLRLGEPGRTIIVEEFIDGHEGFYDTISIDGVVTHDFVAHYYPSCLEALQDRRIAPQIAVSNRIEAESYRELREIGARVVTALGLGTTATHMEWFFGSKGLKVSEIGARPAGERIWDMYGRANEVDIYLAWAEAVLTGRTSLKLSRRLAAGSVQIRPDRDGRVSRHTGLDEVGRHCRSAIYEYEVPRPGAPTAPLEKGWLVNTWFRLIDPDYDRLRELMSFIGTTVKTFAQ